MDITKAQSAGYKITYIAMPGETGPRVLLDLRSPIQAVKAQIIAAYGEAVFKAANAYAKANPIVAPLIIEDYNLVCSLPYETRPSGLPYRYLVGDGTAYIDTGLYFAENGSYEIKYRLGTFSNYPMLIGTNWNDGNGFAIDQSSGSSTQIQIRGYAPSYTVGTSDVVLKIGWTQFEMNGTTVSTGRTAITSSSTIWLGGVRSYSKWRGRIYYAIYKEGDDTIRHFVPFERDGVAGYMDLINAVFYPPVSGTYTIAVE